MPVHHNDMRAQDLDLRELLRFEPEGGVMLFGEERVVLFDPVALGLLRRLLVDALGATGARGMLTHLGFAHGWRTAEAMKTSFPWDDEREWRIAGGRLHKLMGLVDFAPVKEPHPSAPFAEAIWRESYEAEQSLSFFGQSEEPVCWMLCGFASGYLSFCNDKPIYCFEARCRGRGDAICHVFGRPKEEWGPERAAEMQFFEKNCLEGSLANVTASLKKAERVLRERKRALARTEPKDTDPSGIVARSEPMQRALDLARRVAKVDATVLITGESGAGKEKLARLVHNESARAERPFVALNCAAVPETLLESELFGHARGAFTGAIGDRAGIFEAAHGGTLLLDEVGDVPPAMQAKLLRALQEREVRRLGENKNRKVDVRIIAATNRDLAADVVSGRFRQDLFYRLRVVEVRIPALRERREDILPLARLLLGESAQRLGVRARAMTPAAATQVARYSWPGNVRELMNAMERAAVVANGPRVDVEDLPDEVRAASHGSTHVSAGTLEDVEREHILHVLAQNHGNKARAAEQLGIGTATLFRKLRRWAA
jgi:two-component system, NtrC family, response regulator HydG